MKNLFKQILLYLSHNPILQKIARKLFVYSPKFKLTLRNFLDKQYVKKNNQSKDKNFLNTIKKEIEEERSEQYI